MKCSECGNEFDGRKGSNTCSAQCRQARKLRLARVRYKANRPTRQFVCIECETPFTTNAGDKRRRYCSSLCRRKHVTRAKEAAKRARKAAPGAVVETIDSVAIFARDRWVCQLCHVSTPRRLMGSLDECAPTLGHIVPLSCCGNHVPDNVHTVCRRCAQTKRANTKGQFLMFGRVMVGGGKSLQPDEAGPFTPPNLSVGKNGEKS